MSSTGIGCPGRPGGILDHLHQMAEAVARVDGFMPDYPADPLVAIWDGVGGQILVMRKSKWAGNPAHIFHDFAGYRWN